MKPKNVSSLCGDTKFIVYKSSLEQLLPSQCLLCRNHKQETDYVCRGWALLLTFSPHAKKCYCQWEWASQPFSGMMPQDNLVFAVAILFSGASPVCNTCIIRIILCMNCHIDGTLLCKKLDKDSFSGYTTWRHELLHCVRQSAYIGQEQCHAAVSKLYQNLLQSNLTLERKNWRFTNVTYTILHMGSTKRRGQIQQHRGTTGR